MITQLATNNAPPRTFIDRHSAGLALAYAARGLRLPPGTIVLGLPRGGVPVAFELAKALRLPLDVLVVRKIGLPENPELAIGAIALGDVVVRAPGFAGFPHVPVAQFDKVAQVEKRELLRRERAYRSECARRDLTGRRVVIVDDGVATGATMIAAIRAARKAGATRVIAAAPVASAEAAARIRPEADETLFIRIPTSLSSVGEWYEDFRQVEDAEVCDLLQKATGEHE